MRKKNAELRQALMNKNQIESNVQNESAFLRGQMEKEYREMKERYGYEAKLREKQIQADLKSGFEKRAQALQQELKEKGTQTLKMMLQMQKDAQASQKELTQKLLDAKRTSVPAPQPSRGLLSSLLSPVLGVVGSLTSTVDNLLPLGGGGYGGGGLMGGLLSPVTNTLGGLTNTVGGLTSTVGGLTNGLTSTAGGLLTPLTSTVGGLTNGLTNTAGGLLNPLTNTVGGLTSTAGGLLNPVTSTAGGLLGRGGVGGLLNPVTKTADSFLPIQGGTRGLLNPVTKTTDNFLPQATGLLGLGQVTKRG